MKKLLVCIVMVFLAANFVLAADDDKAGKTPKQRGAAGVRERVPSAAGRNRMNREQRYKQMLAKRAEVHQKQIAELDAIKKIAEEEGAKRTAEAIQKLIDKKKADYKKTAVQMEKDRRKRAEKMRGRMETPSMKRRTEAMKKEGSQEEKQEDKGANED